MKVNVVTDKKTVPFKKIRLGDCLLFEGNPCMRINSNTLAASAGMCVNLETGAVYGCSYDQEVVPMTAECTLMEEMEDDV